MTKEQVEKLVDVYRAANRLGDMEDLSGSVDGNDYVDPEHKAARRGLYIALIFASAELDSI
jgi:hypothetical protein